MKKEFKFWIYQVRKHCKFKFRKVKWNNVLMEVTLYLGNQKRGLTKDIAYGMIMWCCGLCTVLYWWFKYLGERNTKILCNRDYFELNNWLLINPNIHVCNLDHSEYRDAHVVCILRRERLGPVFLTWLIPSLLVKQEDTASAAMILTGFSPSILSSALNRERPTKTFKHS